MRNRISGSSLEVNGVEPRTVMELYRRMVTTRLFEETHMKMILNREISLMGHFGTGQEAIGVGMAFSLRPTDYLFPTHRGVAEFIGKGMRLDDIWAEYFCKPAGPCRGKGGLHLAKHDIGIPGLVGSLGADYSIAVGTALSAKLRESDQVTVYSFGDGTANQADFGSALNAAAVWQLPLVFTCTNNQWVEYTFYRELTSTVDIAPRAEGYGIPWTIVEDANDVICVYRVTRDIVEKVRSGTGPHFIEYKTYRAGPHWSGDDGKYMPVEELEKWKAKDPITLCEQYLLSHRIATTGQLEEIKESALHEIKAAIDRARSLPDPTLDEMLSGVYQEEAI